MADPKPWHSVIIGQKELTHAEFQRYVQSTPEEAQKIYDSAPLSKEARETRDRLIQDQAVSEVMRYVPPRNMEAHVEEQMAREAKIAARDLAGAYAAKQALEGPHSAMLGQLANSSIGQQFAQLLNAPGKMFSRSDILAIIRGQHGISTAFEAKEALDALARIFERME